MTASFNKLSGLLTEQLLAKGTHLYLFRHGQSMGDHAGSLTGWVDSKLSIQGREQCNSMFRAFHKHVSQFTAIHSSDLTRCKESLNLALGFPNRKINYDSRLRQIDFGDDEGTHFDSLPKEKKEVINSWKYQAPKGESWVGARNRAMGYLRGLQQGHHFISSHGGVTCALVYHLGLKYVVSNCSVVCVEMDGASKQLSKINFVWEYGEQ